MSRAIVMASILFTLPHPALAAPSYGDLAAIHWDVRAMSCKELGRVPCDCKDYAAEYERRVRASGGHAVVMWVRTELSSKRLDHAVTASGGYVLDQRHKTPLTPRELQRKGYTFNPYQLSELARQAEQGK